MLEGLDFACDERVNLFVGPNATGKSTILRAIKALHTMVMELQGSPPQNYHMRGIFTHGGRGIAYNDEVNYSSPGGGLGFSIEVSDDWPRDNVGAPDLRQVPFMYIPATRISLPATRVFDPHVIDRAFEEPGNVGSAAMLERLFDTESGIFDGRFVELAIDQLRREMVEDRGQQYQFRTMLNLALGCAMSICSEVIADGLPHTYVDLYETPDARRSVHHAMGIGTRDSSYHTQQPLYAGALSSGTQGTLLWIYALAIKMFTHYGLPEDAPWMGWQEKPAVLLIDEIENHLHPTWQRRVIPALLEHFPSLQIFATTHSPFVVAGLKAGQVHLLKRDENGVVTATTNEEDVIGWTADEILRNMMGVDDPTDNETAEAARELRQLRSEGPRSSPEEEQDRQERMQELRQRVDRDLLAGGPWKKQRELFEEQFAEALQKYRESKDMNQENG